MGGHNAETMLITLACASLLLEPATSQMRPLGKAFIKEALGWREMIPLQRERVDMDKATATLCAPASQAFGPHYKPFIRTYVTAGALAKPLPKKGQIELPVGTMLVKEKYDSASAGAPSLITAMKKVKKGRGSGVWEFGMIDLKTKKQIRSVKQPCVSCHSHWKENDGVSHQSSSLLRNWKPDRNSGTVE